MKVVVATGNPHKVAEIQAAFADFNQAREDWEFVPLSDLGSFPEPVEDGDTFLDNARIKACAAVAATGLPCLADDSGLEVDALGGRPGVRSSRYAGEHATDGENNQLLLFELSGTPDGKRTARFRTVLVLLYPDGSEVTAEGAVEGFMGREPRGDNGFGYDPLFYPAIYQGETTMAELSMEQKNRISHRGNALAALRRRLEAAQG